MHRAQIEVDEDLPQGFIARSLLCFPALDRSLFLGPRASSIPVRQGRQGQPPVSYKLIAVKVTGSKRFTPEEVAAASGLPIGTVAHEEDFKKAARQLGETGAFGDITYTYSYSSAGTKLDFHVTDADKFVPARFADFVWFTDEELLHKLHERHSTFQRRIAHERPFT